MRELVNVLEDYAPEMLEVIANRWDVDLPVTADKREMAAVLLDAMLDADQVTAIWDRLDDGERQSLQLLLGARDAKMPTAQFERMGGGEVRQIGPVRLRREKPYLNPTGPAEKLYYKGLIAQAMDEAATGLESFTFVPLGLRSLFPTARGSAFAVDAEPAAPQRPAYADPQNVRPAEDTAVDDLTTLLAFFQVQALSLSENGSLQPDDLLELLPFLLNKSADRVAMLIGIAKALDMLEESEGIWKPAPKVARPWLEQDFLPQQVEMVRGWFKDPAFNELLHIPSLICERVGNDPSLARRALWSAFDLFAPGEWWSISELVGAIKEAQPDFQRPGGDYDSWYIKDKASGEYVRGFESWDQVEGALLRYLLKGPARWLGLVDASEHMFRMTDLLATLLDAGGVPRESAPVVPLELDADGIARVPRAFSRYDRFQLARVTVWEAASAEGYVYRFGPAGAERAKAQGIRTEHVLAYLRRVIEGEIPAAVESGLERWASGSGTLSLSRVVILRGEEISELDKIFEEPELRQYLGRRLGPDALTVRRDRWSALLDALRERGYTIETDGLES